MSVLSNQRVAYFNGKIVPEREVVIPFRDRSFTKGDGVFDMTRSFNGHIFKIKEHIDRVYRSLHYTQIDCGLKPKEMIEISEDVLNRNVLKIESLPPRAVPVCGRLRDMWQEFVRGQLRRSPCLQESHRSDRR